jgi:hypothetical protein
MSSLLRRPARPLRHALSISLGIALSACATRAVPDSFASTSALSPEARSGPAPVAAVALREDPPLPDEPSDSGLWRALDDPDAAVFALPSDPGASWGGAQQTPSQETHTHSTGGQHHGP